MGDTSNVRGYLRRVLEAPRPHLAAQGSSEARAAAKRTPKVPKYENADFGDSIFFQFCDFGNFGNTAYV